MMKRYIIILFSALNFIGCSAPKFISEEERQSAEEKAPAPDYGTIEGEYTEYENMPVLESDIGVASYYAKKFNGRKTASGEIYKNNGFTAAHLKYPFGTIVRVVNQKNGKSVIVKVNDRVRTDNGRAIDISYKAAETLGMIRDGLAKVKVEVLEWGK